VTDTADGPDLLYLSASDTTKDFDWRAAIEAIAAAYRAPLDPAAAPPRAVARGEGVWFRALAAVSPSRRFMGAKLFGMSRQKRVSYLIALFDQETGALSWLLDAREITAMRTAATSAAAVDLLAPPGPARVAVLGSGSEAFAHAEAVASVRPISSLRVYSPTPSRRQAFAARFGERHGVECRAAGSPSEAVLEADLVVAAARSRDETPILLGEWLAPGATVVSIGSTLPEQREIDPEVVRRARLVVADVPHEVSAETGDMIAARAAGVEFDSKLVSLADLVRGAVPVRRGRGEILLFKSVGSALQDIAVAEMCVDRARRQGLGTPLAAGLSIKVLR
jgi:ornithine cyclodeaminase/alanine dehydrogenase